MIALPRNPTDADRWLAYSKEKLRLQALDLPLRDLEVRLRLAAVELRLVK